MSIETLIETIKNKGLLQAMGQLEQLYQLAIDNEKKLTESERYGRQADITIENLERKLERLAAENAALKSAIPKLKDIEYDNDNMDDVSLAEDIGFNDAVTLMNRWMPETPATDAILAEVRASGVEMFAKHKRDEAMSMHSDTFALGSVVASLDMQANELEEFAAQLRQEAK